MRPMPHSSMESNPIQVLSSVDLQAQGYCQLVLLGRYLSGHGILRRDEVRIIHISLPSSRHSST